MAYAWELRVDGGDGGLWYFEIKPTRLQCEQRRCAVGGDRYTLKRVACPDGVYYSPLT